MIFLLFLKGPLFFGPSGATSIFPTCLRAFQFQGLKKSSAQNSNNLTFIWRCRMVPFYSLWTEMEFDCFQAI